MTGPSAVHSVAREIVDAVAPILTPGDEKQPSTPQLIAALQQCAGWQMLQPARYGGLAMAADESVTVIGELAAMDASLGWLSAMFNAAAHEVGGLPGAAADEVWRGDAKALIAPGYGSEGRLTVSGDESRLSGCWRSVAGADLADWLLLTADGDGGRYRVLLPREQVSTKPTRNPSGLFGTDICDVTVSDVAVPGNRIFELPVSCVAGAAAAATVVGAADGVWRLHVREIRQRLSASYGGEDVMDRPSSTIQVGRAACDIDAARLQLGASLEASIGTAEAEALRAATWEQLQAAGRARDAADELLASSRRHALQASDPVTRLWQGTHACFRLATRLLDGVSDGR
ncbi:hypothetical protein [Mycolicibacter longobardus]|uniref:Acyl-CoA dehydrogenase C-terminal domain-containing protein n=1 Tax=Mycolicibacter longobardus TaxID=1108812 RepID=A0A1X1YJK7_9MYCO|nr:hypothetical protein [Mycolicibacter longobardus]MCV7385508.1 hypothetical protein [Mycolicibacter longobardus]ORW11215.1 hypothetical protein AWC16_11625 [Mycolicibacter longobardus]